MSDNDRPEELELVEVVSEGKRKLSLAERIILIGERLDIICDKLDKERAKSDTKVKKLAAAR